MHSNDEKPGKGNREAKRGGEEEGIENLKKTSREERKARHFLLCGIEENLEEEKNLCSATQPMGKCGEGEAFTAEDASLDRLWV